MSRKKKPSPELSEYLAELGKKGGKARAQKRTKEQRSAEMSLRAKQRWDKAKEKGPQE